MQQATEIYSREFDAVLLNLPLHIKELVLKKIRDLGRRLEQFPHHRLQGRTEYRLRAGDYRIIYDFSVEQNEIRLIALGHRSDVYRC